MDDITEDTDRGLTRRAFAAYFRAGGTDQPSDSSGVVEHDGLTYIVLYNVSGTLAVYRIRPTGALKRLRRWPAPLDQN